MMDIFIRGLKFTTKGGPGSGHHGHTGGAGGEGNPGGSRAGIGTSAQGTSSAGIEHAKGVLAARRLGGQVPQKDVNAAERILQRAGLMPTTRKAPKGGLTKEYLANYYEKYKPVTGDIWNMPKGGYVEIGNIASRRSFNLEGQWVDIPGYEINVHIVGSGGGRTTTIYTERTWE